MCGIAATINGTDYETAEMGKAIIRRGTRSTFWQSGNLRVFFTWLPITDPDAQIQPFVSGKYTVFLVGYISNYKELSERYHIKLESNCDTELLAKFIAKFNYERLDELNGMFAVLSYADGEVKMFTDRYGIKQLYTYTSGETTYIASEVKAIQAVNSLSFSEFGVNDWKYSLGVMNENTIYEGVLRVKRLPFIMPDKINIGFEDAKTILRGLLKQSFRRNRTKLKTGVLLSGGIDSGLIAREMKPDYCFSMDYADPNLSEYENIIRNSQGEHSIMTCTEQTFADYAPKVLPVIDDLKVGSCYTNYALIESASKKCTVLYSGAGGDEVFSGYTHRYNRTVNQVIKRTQLDLEMNYPAITHKEYDWAYLRGILVVEDRISSHFTMETRYPFLDNDLVNFALSLPDNYVHNKLILKEICDLPKEVIEGKKRGFCNPVSNETWIKYTLDYATKRIKTGRLIQPAQPV